MSGRSAWTYENTMSLPLFQFYTLGGHGRTKARLAESRIRKTQQVSFFLRPVLIPVQDMQTQARQDHRLFASDTRSVYTRM